MGWWRDFFDDLTVKQPASEPQPHHPDVPPPPQVLTGRGLTAMGIGATIGAGIFVTAGQVARDVTGPAVIVSFVIAGLACALAGLCNAEFAAMSPSGDSAYTNASATMGELLAWIIGLVVSFSYGSWSSGLRSRPATPEGTPPGPPAGESPAQAPEPPAPPPGA